jgi:hypothetical protein
MDTGLSVLRCGMINDSAAMWAFILGGIVCAVFAVTIVREIARSFSAENLRKGATYKRTRAALRQGPSLSQYNVQSQAWSQPVRQCAYCKGRFTGSKCDNCGAKV